MGRRAIALRPFEPMRKLLIAMLLLTAGGFALLAWEPPAPLAHGESADAQRRASPDAAIGSAADAHPELRVQPLCTGSQVVAHKYRYLLDDLGVTEQVRVRVLELLARREALAPAPGFGSEPLAAIDAARSTELATIDAALRRELAPDCIRGIRAVPRFRRRAVSTRRIRRRHSRGRTTRPRAGTCRARSQAAPEAPLFAARRHSRPRERAPVAGRA